MHKDTYARGKFFIKSQFDISNYFEQEQKQDK